MGRVAIWIGVLLVIGLAGVGGYLAMRIGAGPELRDSSVESNSDGSPLGNLKTSTDSELLASAPSFRELAEQEAVTEFPEPETKPIISMDSEEAFRWYKEQTSPFGVSVLPVDRGYRLSNPRVPIVLGPFLRLDPVDSLAEAWDWNLQKIDPPTFIASKEGSRAELIAVMERNLYEDAESFNQAFWRQRVNGVKGEGHRTVRASPIQEIDDSGTRWQFWITGGEKRHVAITIIHHREFVFTLYSVARDIETLGQGHRLLSNVTVLDIPEFGDLPKAVESQLRKRMDEALSLIQRNKTDELLKLITRNQRYRAFQRDPKKFEAFKEVFRQGDQRDFATAFGEVDFSQAAYLADGRQVAIQYAPGKLIYWDREGYDWHCY